MYNSMKFLLLSSLMFISSNSWLGFWMGLEINLLSIIPVLTNNMNSMINELIN